MRLRDRYRTQFCFIAPAELLDRYATVSRTHLLLPQVKHPKYVEFYQRKRREGDLLILDNGAYEGETDWDQLVLAIHRYNPQVVALPDYLLTDGELTYNVAGDFLTKYRKNFPNVKWMYIPQAEPGDIHGFYRWMNKAIKTIKPDWIGVPRALATHVAPHANKRWARVDLVEELTMRGIKTHALGMANGDLEELDRLAWEGVCTCDSSCAVWRGLQGFNLEADDKQWEKVGTPIDFHYSKPGNTGEHMVMLNINAVLRACGREEINWQTRK